MHTTKGPITSAWKWALMRLESHRSSKEHIQSHEISSILDTNLIQISQ
jgi:hypothetical protein